MHAQPSASGPVCELQVASFLQHPPRAVKVTCVAFLSTQPFAASDMEKKKPVRPEGRQTRPPVWMQLPAVGQRGTAVTGGQRTFTLTRPPGRQIPACLCWSRKHPRAREQGPHAGARAPPPAAPQRHLSNRARRSGPAIPAGSQRGLGTAGPQAVRHRTPAPRPGHCPHPIHLAPVPAREGPTFPAGPASVPGSGSARC